MKCFGEGLKTGFTNQANKFTIDATNAGYGALTLSIEGPSKAELDCGDNPDGTNDVSYVPFEPGTYHVNVKYADGHVTGSPFTVEVLERFAEAERGDSVVRRRERLLQQVTREREAASVAQVGTLCEMNIALPASQKEPFELSSWVRAPSGHFEKCEVASPDRRNFVIRFTPHEVGVHQVEIRLNGLGIPGSPFLFTVGSPASGVRLTDFFPIVILYNIVILSICLELSIFFILFIDIQFWMFSKHCSFDIIVNYSSY